MKAKLCLILILMMLVSTSVYSSGALRHILPFLSELTSSQMKEGEIAYDDVSKTLVLKNNETVTEVGGSIIFGYEDLPRINTQILGNASTFAPLIYVDISPGIFATSGKLFKNTTYTSCVYNETSPTLGLGAFDGSTKPVATPPGEKKNPMYLYLIQAGNGFNCILSFNSTGPSSTYTSGLRWLRVQTIVGESFGGQGPTLRTVGLKTYARNTSSLQLTLPAGEELSVSDPYIMTASMKSITLSGYTCPTASEWTSIMEKITTPTFTKIKRPRLASRFVEVSSCSSFGVKTADPDEYLFVEGERKVYFSTSGMKFLNIIGWTETPLSN